MKRICDFIVYNIQSSENDKSTALLCIGINEHYICVCVILIYIQEVEKILDFLLYIANTRKYIEEMFIIYVLIQKETTSF